jgi:polyisoprenoid-binding protein YceI
MKITKTLATVIAIIFAFAFSYPGSPAGNGKGETSLKVDKEKSSIEWTGTKVGGQHTGTIGLSNGHLNIKNGKPAGGKFTIDMTSIVNSDVEDPEYRNKLENHLKSDDFFGAEKFPEAMLEITGISPLNDKDKYNITGNITIKGITKAISFPAIIVVKGNKAAGEAEFEIDRSEFNVRYGSGKFFDNLGDKVIYDNFKLRIRIVAVS